MTRPATFLQTLLPTATVGTDRMAPRGGLGSAFGGAVGAALERLDAQGAHDDPATRLLRQAGMVALCARAGQVGDPATQTLPPAPPDLLPALDHVPTLAAIAWSLQNGPLRLQHEALRLTGARGWRLPALAVPPALEAGRRSVMLREALQAAIGERGRWLAAREPGWQYAAGVAEQVRPDATDDRRWDEGSLDQRRAFLREERRRDPEAARHRLTAALAELPARDRADLVNVLAENLSPADTSLLEQLRRDRSREVRQTALALQLRLPASAQGERAAQRLAPLLQHERGLLRKRWAIEAPQAAADDWKADDIEAARPKHESLGERAWWLYQLVRQVPLGWWTTHTGMDAAALLAWANDTDWAAALVRGWRDVLLAAPDVAWAQALLDHWPAKHLNDDSASVMAQLPLALRERYWLAELDALDTERGTDLTRLADLANRLVAACAPGDSLSATFSQRYVALLRTRLHHMQGVLRAEYTLRQALPELVCALDLQAVAPLATQPIETETPSALGLMQQLAPIVVARLALAAMPVSHRRSPS